jgi:hypothetical protein
MRTSSASGSRLVRLGFGTGIERVFHVRHGWSSVAPALSGASNGDRELERQVLALPLATGWKQMRWLKAHSLWLGSGDDVANDIFTSLSQIDSKRALGLANTSISMDNLVYITKHRHDTPSAPVQRTRRDQKQMPSLVLRPGVATHMCLRLASTGNGRRTADVGRGATSDSGSLLLTKALGKPMGGLCWCWWK